MRSLRKLFAVRTKVNPIAQSPGSCIDGRPSQPVQSERDQLNAAVATSRLRGRYAESLSLVNAALRGAPADGELLFEKASTLFAWGRVLEAHESSVRARVLGFRHQDLELLLGWSSFRMGRLEEAESWMREATEMYPERAEPQFNLAVVLQAQGRFEEATRCYERALQFHPDHFESMMGVGNCELAQKQFASAEACFRRAIAVHGKRSTTLTHLGVALGHQDRDLEAFAAFQDAVRIETAEHHEGDGLVNLAINLRDTGRTAEALEVFEGFLPWQPSVHGHLSYAHGLLRAGRLPEGWTHYEYRWLQDPLWSLRSKLPCPLWGGQNLRGKRILLLEEQGLGDTIQFIRYASLLQELGAIVLLKVRPSMARFAACFPGIARVLAPDEAVPDVDFYIPLLSLPRVFGTDLTTIPADIPYLHADPARVDRWKERLESGDRLKVGIVWAGSPLHAKDRYRSLSLDALAPLKDVAGVRYFSLQKGPASAEIARCSLVFDVVDLNPELEDFGDTAAVISQLDLTISVDTAVAHLAGALGKPVWVMVPRVPDFRWMERREDSPWYPTMRLFRQEKGNEWNEVIHRVRSALQELVRSGNLGLRPAAVGKVSSNSREPHVPNLGAASHVRPGHCAVAETRVGILQYRPDLFPVGKSIDWYGEYLQSQVNLLARIIQPGSTILEAGADVGVHTIALANVVGPQGHLFLYESDPLLRGLLQQNLAANEVRNVTVMQRMLAQSPGSDTSQAGSAETVDDLQLDRLDWLKVNDGGSALGILAGASGTLWRLRPLLFVAASDEQALAILARRAKEYGYRSWRMETSLFDACNFNRRDTDIFAGETRLALLAVPEEIRVEAEFHGCVEL